VALLETEIHAGWRTGRREKESERDWPRWVSYGEVTTQ
jgi:hypothetical protein